MKKSTDGFTLLEIMIVVAIIGLLAALAMPSLSRARARSQVNYIKNDLRLISGAKDLWAMSENKGNGEPVDEDGVNQFMKRVPTPPVQGQTYIYNPVGEKPEFSGAAGEYIDAKL